MIQSKKIDRYNDDFYLKFNSDSSKYGQSQHTFNEINKNNDWSISFYLVVNSSSTQAILDTRTNLNGNSSKGWEIALSSNKLLWVLGAGSSSSSVSIGDTIEFDKWYSFILSYDSSLNNLTLHSNSVKVDDITLSSIFEPSDSLTPISTFGKFGNNPVIPLNGGIRDFTTYDKQLSKDEISYIYKTGVPPVSAYSNIQHYYPLNEIPTETGGNYFMSDKAESFNSSATNSEVELIGWTGTELGIPTNTTATTYRDWTTKANYIPDVGYKLGLNFDSSKQQYLEVTGLNSFSLGKGYTVLMGWKRDDEVISNNESTFGYINSANSYTNYMSNQISAIVGRVYFRINGRGDIYQDGLSVKSPNLSVITMADNNEIVSAYSNTGISTQSSFNGVYSSIIDNNVNHQGFDERGGICSIGCLDPSGSIGWFFNGKISYAVVINDVLSMEDVKKLMNNNLYRSPYEVLQDTSKIILDVDFQNPFVDGTDIKFPDNSGNCEVIAKQNSGTDWSTLVGVQNSID